ncbi:MAG: homoserine kinase [Hyphomonadaceae bacterium]
MAVYTALSDEDIAALLALYDIGSAVKSEGVAEGVENTNYKLITSKGRYILTLFEKRVAERDLPFFMAVMERLAQRGFEAPQPIATRGGDYLTRVKGKPAAIVSFLDGVWPRKTELQHCAAIGDALARMHVALEGFTMERANSLSLEGWEVLIEPRLAEAEALRPGLAALIERDMAEARAAWPGALPRGVVHADLFPDNALFESAKLGGVIDFYFACTDFLAYDLAVCLNAWCFREEQEYDLARGRAMIDAYAAVRPPTDAERAAVPILARGAALRFFATRLTDWIATPNDAQVTPKDPLEYADKLAFHRTAQSAADYGA